MDFKSIPEFQSSGAVFRNGGGVGVARFRNGGVSKWKGVPIGGESPTSISCCNIWVQVGTSENKET